MEGGNRLSSFIVIARNEAIFWGRAEEYKAALLASLHSSFYSLGNFYRSEEYQ